MRRHEKEITNLADIESVIRRCQVCRLGMCTDGQPYIVPMSFGYRDKTVYLHSAKTGRKIDALTANSSVCLEFDTDVGLVTHSTLACKWGMDFSSVIAFGRADFISDQDERQLGLSIIMAQYSNKTFMFDDAALDMATIIKVTISSMTGKTSIPKKG